MATRNGDLNIPLQIDEALLGPIFVVASAVQAKVATISLFGVGLSSNFYTVGSTSITWAAALAIGSLIAAYFLYEVELGKLDQTQTLAAVATVALPIGTALVPSLQSWVTGSYVVGGASVAIQAAGFVALTYMAEKSMGFDFSLN